MIQSLPALDFRPAPAPAVGPGMHALFAPVAADIEAAERVFAETLRPHRGPLGDLVAHLAHYRGKRLRPAMLLLAARACGQVTPAHHTLAAVVEMVHTATLVHDDVLDDADTRRHVATVNARFGNKTSILFGDLLFTHAFHLASTVDGRACRLIGHATNRVCAGELQQVAHRGNLHLTEPEYFQILDGKTAALTEVSARLGALYAGATEQVADDLAAYGHNLGMAFQVADDLLDLTGDELTAGKTLGTDLDQQKLTLPIIHALNELPPAGAERFRDLLRGTHPDKPLRVLATLRETDALNYAKQRADEFAAAAQAALATLPRSDARAVLEAMARVGRPPREVISWWDTTTKTRRYLHGPRHPRPDFACLDPRRPPERCRGRRPARLGPRRPQFHRPHRRPRPRVHPRPRRARHPRTRDRVKVARIDLCGPRIAPRHRQTEPRLLQPRRRLPQPRRRPRRKCPDHD